MCIRAELENTIEAASKVDVVSPNHAELGELFGKVPHAEDGSLDRSVIEDCARHLCKSRDTTDWSITAVVRCGRDGCYVYNDRQAQWLPAYHASSPEKVIDPTGGGNGFLGGFAVGLVRTKDAIKAAIWGSVSASFCIEQVGVPTLSQVADQSERWNGVNVGDRLADFERRCCLHKS